MFFTEKKIKEHCNDNFSDVLFWDFDKNSIDIQKMKDTITERVIHMGKDEDFYALFNNYGGIYAVREIIKNLKHIDEKDIGFVCAAFDIREDELRCLKEVSYKKELMNCLKR